MTELSRNFEVIYAILQTFSVGERSENARSRIRIPTFDREANQCGGRHQTGVGALHLKLGSASRGAFFLSVKCRKQQQLQCFMKIKYAKYMRCVRPFWKNFPIYIFTFSSIVVTQLLSMRKTIAKCVYFRVQSQASGTWWDFNLGTRSSRVPGVKAQYRAWQFNAWRPVVFFSMGRISRPPRPVH